MTFPDNLKYTSDHEWIRLDKGDMAYVGITDYAQDALGELVYIEVESVGETLDANAVFGTVEAVKTTSELFLPVKATIVEFNDKVGDSGDPAIVNSDPYGDGWLVKIKIHNMDDVKGLMDAAAYQAEIA